MISPKIPPKIPSQFSFIQNVRTEGILGGILGKIPKMISFLKIPPRRISDKSKRLTDDCGQQITRAA